MIMPPRLRKLALTTHVATSVALLGAVSMLTIGAGSVSLALFTACAVALFWRRLAVHVVVLAAGLAGLGWALWGR